MIFFLKNGHLFIKWPNLKVLVSSAKGHSHGCQVGTYDEIQSHCVQHISHLGPDFKLHK